MLDVVAQINKATLGITFVKKIIYSKNIPFFALSSARVIQGKIVQGDLFFVEHIQ